MARDLIKSDATIRAIKPGAVDPATGKPLQRLNDGDGLSLLLFVKGGSHGWRFAYSLHGRRNIISLGTYPDTGLSAARKKAQEAREMVAAGADPSAARKGARKAHIAQREAVRREAAGLPGVGTFEAVARDWLRIVHSAKVVDSHAKRTQTRLENDVFPWLGRRPISQIEAPELLQCLRRVEARGAIETAHRIKDACGQVFRFGIAEGHCTRNPAADLKDALRPVESRHHAAIVDPAKAGALLRDMMGYQGHMVTRAALALSALLMLRPGELRHLEWSWVDFDSAQVVIPAMVMKRKKAEKLNSPPHVVPLATQAVAILRELQDLTGEAAYVFPSLLSTKRCMSENTVRGALRRMGYSNDDMTAHGFRAMARTMIAERLGVDPQVIEAQLAHAKAGALGSAYDRAEFLDQRRDMMSKWADYLDRLREGAQVIGIKSKAA